jgi:hypothetical protein
MYEFEKKNESTYMKFFCNIRRNESFISPFLHGLHRKPLFLPISFFLQIQRK